MSGTGQDVERVKITESLCDSRATLVPIVVDSEYQEVVSQPLTLPYPVALSLYHSLASYLKRQQAHDWSASPRFSR